jgi:hypothetical protein
MRRRKTSTSTRGAEAQRRAVLAGPVPETGPARGYMQVLRGIRTTHSRMQLSPTALPVNAGDLERADIAAGAAVVGVKPEVDALATAAVGEITFADPAIECAAAAVRNRANGLLLLTRRGHAGNVAALAEGGAQGQEFLLLAAEAAHGLTIQAVPALLVPPMLRADTLALAAPGISIIMLQERHPGDGQGRCGLDQAATGVFSGQHPAESIETRPVHGHSPLSQVSQIELETKRNER